MLVEEFLKKSTARVSLAGAWLYWDNNEWVVVERLAYKKKNIVLYRGTKLSDALKTLSVEAQP